MTSGDYCSWCGYPLPTTRHRSLKYRPTKKLFLVIALSLVLLLSGSGFAYTYATTSGTIGATAATGDIASPNATESQPDWDSVMDVFSEDLTCGDVPAGVVCV